MIVQASDVKHMSWRKKYYDEKYGLIWYGSIGTGQFEGLKVPAYVYEAGVHSITDLKKEKFKEKFRKDGGGLKVQSLCGSLGARTHKALGEYSLDNWEGRVRDIQSLVKKAERILKNERWGVFTWWDPWWGTVKCPDMKYLEDPKGIFQGTREQCYWVVNENFPDRYPLAAKLMRNFFLSKESLYQITEWKYEKYGKTVSEKNEETAIRKASEWWVREHWRNWRMWWPYPYKVPSINSPPENVYRKFRWSRTSGASTRSPETTS